MSVRFAKPQDADRIGQIQAETWRTTYSGMLSEKTLANLSAERNAAQWRQMLTNPASVSFAVVIEDDAGQVIGFAAAGPERTHHPQFQGEIYALYVLQSSQRQGAGRELMCAAAAELADRGLNSLLIWVLRDNRIGNRFYQTMGGVVVVQERGMVLDDHEVAEIGYGWPDLRRWLEQF